MDRDTVWPAMAAAFEAATGDLADRMLAALEAAEAEGGDIRGAQSASLIVVGPERGDARYEGRRVDLRVDDSPKPLVELVSRLPASGLLPDDPELLRAIREMAGR